MRQIGKYFDIRWSSLYIPTDRSNSTFRNHDLVITIWNRKSKILWIVNYFYLYRLVISCDSAHSKNVFHSYFRSELVRNVFWWVKVFKNFDVMKAWKGLLLIMRCKNCSIEKTTSEIQAETVLIRWSFCLPNTSFCFRIFLLLFLMCRYCLIGTWTLYRWFCIYMVIGHQWKS